MKMKTALALLGVTTILLASCVSNPEGERAATTDAIETNAVADGTTLAIDTSASQVVWHANKVSKEHFGEISLTSGNINVSSEGKITGGNFTIDMNSIDVQDSEGESRDKLTGHLKNEDFFDVPKYPTATFEITSVTEGATASDLVIAGNLNMHGVTKNITFNAKVTESTPASVVADADFNVAREDWGITYTGKADDLISKEFNLKIKIVAKNQA
ncbi:YceI family protein [Albibacterium bauzanense]|uniref:YceI-like domain-containing protein n=1 Tax=Albibacterium bauzanense TaxID=653929 RepID=A0A4R1M0S1_9SPHI|nr:YceI family protein [Albibacterium bauzanense]TCK85508.1 YceI-like domain-containing protein [Albibacterium bauzanense]